MSSTMGDIVNNFFGMPTTTTGKKDSVTLDKRVFDKAMRIYDKLKDIPEEMIALRGTNDIVSLMFSCMLTKLRESTPLLSLADEIQAHAGMLNNNSFYAPRSELEKQNDEMRKELTLIFSMMKQL